MQHTKINFKQDLSEKYDYSVTNRRIINQNFRDPDTFETFSNFSCNILKEPSSETKNIQIMFDSLSTNNLNGENVVENSSAPLVKSYEAFKGLKLTLKLGNDVVLEGYNEFQEKIDAIYKINYDKEYPMIRPSEAIFPKSYFIDFFDKIFNPIPAEIYLDSIWVEKKKIILLDGQLSLDVTYNIQEIKNDTIFIKGVGKSSQEIEIVDGNFLLVYENVDIIIMLDLTSGILIKSIVEINLNGSMDNRGVKHEISLSEIETTLGKKIK